MKRPQIPQRHSANFDAYALAGHQAEPDAAEALPANPQVPLRRFRWPDGSAAVLDGRGLLHLCPADPAHPEVTLVLVQGHPTAAWVADGTVCGSDYFTGPDPWRRLPAAEFYQQYLEPFIAGVAGSGPTPT